MQRFNSHRENRFNDAINAMERISIVASAHIISALRAQDPQTNRTRPARGRPTSNLVRDS